MDTQMDKQTEVKHYAPNHLMRKHNKAKYKTICLPSVFQSRALSCKKDPGVFTESPQAPNIEQSPFLNRHKFHVNVDSLPNDNCLDLTKLEAFADDK